MFRRVQFAVASVVVLLLVPLLSACGEPQPSTQPTQVQPTAGTGGGGSPTTVNVDMDKFAFSPAEVTIPAGSTIIWTNKEAPPHTATDKAGSFDSGQLKKGESFQRTFDT